MTGIGGDTQLVTGQTTLVLDPRAPEKQKGKAQVTRREKKCCSALVLMKHECAFFHPCYFFTVTKYNLSIMGPHSDRKRNPRAPSKRRGHTIKILLGEMSVFIQ